MTEIPNCVVEYLYDQTILNGGGFVLGPISTPCVPLVGFAVGLGGIVVDKRSSLDSLDTFREALETVQQGNDMVAAVPLGLGTWECECCGQIHIDVTQWVPTEIDAITVAHRRNQIAYYDIEGRETIEMEK